MNSPKEAAQFKGFKNNELSEIKEENEVNSPDVENSEMESPGKVLPNGTEEDMDCKDDKEIEEVESKVSTTSKDLVEEKKEGDMSEPPRKRLRSSSSGTHADKDTKTDKEVKAEKEVKTDDEEKDESFDNVDSSEEDFLGFESSDTNEKEEFLRSLIEDQDSIDSSDSGTPKSHSSGRGDRSSLRKPIAITDVSKPEYRKPFEYGWVRELVYRSTSDSSLKRNADIYYFTPKGKKVRSFREVAENLTGDLTVDNFTFFKGPIGIGDPEKEIIRDAKGKPPFRLNEDGFGSPPTKRATPKSKTSVSSGSASKGGSQESSPEKGNASGTPKVVFKGNATPKVKNSSLKNKVGLKEKKRRSAGPDDLDMGMLPLTSWSPDSKAKTNGVDKQASVPLEATAVSMDKKLRVKETTATSSHYPLTQNFMMNLNAGFVALLHAFQYLKVHELLRASCVSQLWRHIASHKSLWETVHMKNSRVRDWEGFGRTLSNAGTRNLDLRKMLLPEAQDAIIEMWSNFSKAIAQVHTLKRIDFGRCIPDAIESVAKVCRQLESITSLSVRGNQLDVSPIADCTNLVELRLKSLGGIELKNLTALKSLKNLRHLSLTTVKSLIGIEEILCENLESLELGECSGLTEAMATEALPKLVNLKKMRLEKGQGSNCPTMSLLNTISSLQNLTQLELINFDVKPGFDKSLAKCSNLKTLLIIPTYVTQSATTNHVVMGGVSKLSTTLTYFVWGLTLELLRVTDLFIDQVEGQKNKGGAGGGQGGSSSGQPSSAQGSAATKKGTGDSIPILKPIVEDGGGSDGGKEGQAASQVDILALPKLQKVLSTLLPSTKIKILKVPFSATWRQTISESPQ